MLPPIPKPVIVVITVALLAFGGAYAYVLSTQVDCDEDAQACLTSSLTVVSTTIDGATNGPIESTSFEYTDKTVASFAASTLSFAAERPLKALDDETTPECQYWAPDLARVRIAYIGLEADGTYRPGATIGFKLTHDGAPVNRGTITWFVATPGNPDPAVRGTSYTKSDGTVMVDAGTLNDGQFMSAKGYDPLTCKFGNANWVYVRAATGPGDQETTPPAADDTPTTATTVNLPVAIAGRVHAAGTTGAHTVTLHAWLNSSSGNLGHKQATVTAPALTGTFDGLGVMFQDISRSRLKESITIDVLVIVTSRASNGAAIGESHHFTIAKRLNEDNSMTVTLFPAEIVNASVNADGAVAAERGSRVVRRL